MKTKFKCPVCTLRWDYCVTPTFRLDESYISKHITMAAKKEIWMAEFEKVKTPHLDYFRKNKVVRIETVKRYTISYKGI